jgi:IS5 family transposase
MSTPDFFRSRLDAMVDQQHPLFVLADRMPWSQLEAALRHNKKASETTERTELREDLFGVSEQPARRGSPNAGRPALSVRLLCGLLYLKHAYNESDESVCAKWAENPYWQYFCGEQYFQPRLPCNPTKLVQFRHWLEEAGAEELLATTINTAVAIKAVKPSEFERVIVDSTVQEKAIAYPTDSRLLEVARHKLVQMAKKHGLALKQTFAKEGKLLRLQAGRYAHAKQFKRMRKAIKRQRTIVGKLLRAVTGQPLLAGLHREMLARIERVLKQQPKDKNKLYALHAPEVECLSKGKARQPYEFGVKASIAVTAKSGLVVGARAFPGNPYDGHTLAEQLEQTTILLQDIAGAPTPKTVLVDLGYRGVDIDGVDILHRGKAKRLTQRQRNWLKRRSSIEPHIGHLKDDSGLRRCWLKGAIGDARHTGLCAAGYNLRFLMRAIRFFCVAILFGLLAPMLSYHGESNRQPRFRRTSLRWRILKVNF